MPALTITATAGGVTANGIAASIRVLNAAAPAAVQTGATQTQTGAAAHEASITTTVTSSRCFLAAVDFANTAFTADAQTTSLNDNADATNGRRYVRGRANADTGTPGALTLGFTAPTDNGGLAIAEILPAVAGTPTVDTASQPGSLFNISGTAVTSNQFVPASGGLIVFMVAADGGAGVVTMAVTDSLGLTWTELVKSNASGAGYAGVWVAQAPLTPAANPSPVPPGWQPGLPGLPGAVPFWSPPSPSPPAAAAAPTAGPPVYPLGHPVVARQQPAQGGRTYHRAGVYGQAGPPVRVWQGPVSAPKPPPGRGRTTSRAGTFTAAAPTAGPPVYPLGHPVAARRQAAQGGRVIRRAGTYAGTGPPAVPLRKPAGPGRPLPPPARGRTQSQAGPYGQTGPPVVPLRKPARGQPQQPLRTGRAAWRSGVYTAAAGPTFTVGALTAADKATATQGPTDKGGSALTALTAPSGGTLTATDQRTGGPR